MSLYWLKADFVALTASEAEALYGVMPENAANEIIKQHNVKAVFVQETVNRTYFQTSIHSGYYVNDFKSNNTINTGVFSACIAYGILKINKQLEVMTYDDNIRALALKELAASKNCYPTEFAESMLIFSRSYFGLHSFKEATHITLGDFILAKKDSYNSTVFQKTYSNIIMKK